jgi:hypothetical protein
MYQELSPLRLKQQRVSKTSRWQALVHSPAPAIIIPLWAIRLPYCALLPGALLACKSLARQVVA